MSFHTAGLVNNLLRLWPSLSKKNQHKFFMLLLLMLMVSFLEVVGIGAVIPFLGVITNTGGTLVAISNVIPTALVPAFSLNPIFWLTLFFILATFLAASSRIFLLKKSTNLAFKVGAELSVEIYERTLYQPYEIHISRNSSEIVDGVVNKVNSVAYSVLMPVVTLISSSILILVTTFILFLFNSTVAIIIFCGFGSVYLGLAFLAKKRLELNSLKISFLSEKLVQVLQEGLHGIRDVLLDNSQKEYSRKYEKVDVELRSAQATNQFISQSPRFFIEAIGMALIATLAYFLSGKQEHGVGGVAILGAFALGIQRMLPAMQQAYTSWSYLKSNEAALVGILDLLSQSVSEDIHFSNPPIRFDRYIELREISYRYQSSSPWIIESINLVIKKGAKIGFIGKTGCGKSTLLDLAMGLLKPTEGGVLVDGILLNSPSLVKGWQKRIAHVPQHIYLTDKTIAENIAFGIPNDQIDLEKINNAILAAQLNEYIATLADGLFTKVGERGVRLSGGQRQRIGLARALYREADVLILDEATSALDGETEIAVMNSISSLNSGCTILMIAHRLSTLAGCDQIYEVIGGKIKKNNEKLQ